MNAFYIILAACPVLLLGVVAFLVLIAVGVRKGDRRDLASPANGLALGSDVVSLPFCGA